MADLFISYAEEDADVVKEVATTLERAGYSVWYYARDSALSGDYLLEISDELTHCRAVVFVISERALVSSEVYAELVEAHRLGRIKVPLLRGITHAQLRERAAKWAIALGGAVAAELPQTGWDFDALADRIVRGLRKQNLELIDDVVESTYTLVQPQQDQGPGAAEEPTVEIEAPPPMDKPVAETEAPAPVEERVVEDAAPPIASSPGATQLRRPNLDEPGTSAGDSAIGPDGGVYVWVPAGDFYLGADDIAPPSHLVYLTAGFWLGQCTVTNAQYRKYCYEVGAVFPRESNQGDLHPVIWVSWEEASAYCKHYGLALPTEAQWEYAARGPSGRKFPWGNQASEERCCNKENRGPGGTTFPVGSFPEGASWCGALDLAGNVLEWCADWYDEKYYADSPHDDPTGPGSGEYRALRGGAWGNDARNCRSSIRGGEVPTGRDDGVGFRTSKIP